MGFFSWLKSDDGKSIRIDDDKECSAKMLDNKGNFWIELNYEGYGVFGGKDFYILLFEMNFDRVALESLDVESHQNLEQKKVELSILDEQSKRCIGIGLDLNGKDWVIRPKLVSIENDEDWKKIKDSESCPDQGFF